MTAPPREPDAWMYTKEGQEPCFNGHGRRFETYGKEWTEVPLYAAPAPSAEPKRKRCEHDRWPGDDCDICPAPAEPPAQAATDDLVRRLTARAAYVRGEYRQDLRDAADLIERQAREMAELQRKLTNEENYYEDMKIRAERAEAERDALRECIDAADARRKIVSRSNEHLWGAYDAARAKVKK